MAGKPILAARDAATRGSAQSGGPRPRGFCPLRDAGSGASSELSAENLTLMHARMRGATTLLLIGFLLFLGIDRIYDDNLQDVGGAPLVGHIITTFGLAAFTVLLWSRWRPTLCQLRTVEAGVFGSVAAYLVWVQYQNACWCCASGVHVHARAFPAETLLPWLTVIYLYGLYIPNTWKRASVVTGMMVAAPVAVTLFASYSHTEFAEIMAEGYLVRMILWLSLAACASVYGSHKIGSLRREAVVARQIGSYELKKRLGSGGMGEVYLASHRLLKRPCAVKLIRRDKVHNPEAIARFETEVQASAQLTHQNTIEIYDYGHTDDGTFYYAMEYLPGLNLQELIERYGPLPAGRVIHLLQQVASALVEAHAHGLIHRDIKPGNIFAAERGGVHDIAKLLDFGLVKSSLPNEDSPELTMEGALVGSPLYTPPETVTGDQSADARSDIYSLGAVAYYLLTGRPVFSEDKAIKALFAHVHQKVDPPSRFMEDIPADLEALILKCLAKSPSDRYQNAGDLESALMTCRDAHAWTAEASRRWWRKVQETPSAQAQLTAGSYSTAAVLETEDASEPNPVGRTLESV